MRYVLSQHQNGKQRENEKLQCGHEPVASLYIYLLPYPGPCIISKEPIIEIHDGSRGNCGIQKRDILLGPLQSQDAEDKILRSVLRVQSGRILVQPLKESIVQETAQQVWGGAVPPMNTASNERSNNTESIIQFDFREIRIVMEYRLEIWSDLDW